jgi:diguanylate cyclase (GGDEF)-like protein/PAS domain S-box-containing protein
MTVRRLVAGYGGLTAVATVLYLLLSSASYVTVSIVGAVSAGAIIVGVRRYRPRHARSWLMIAAALLLNATARVVYDLLPGSTGTLKPWVWTVWGLHLVMLVCLVVGMLGLARLRAHGAPAVIDAAVIVLGAGLLASILIAIPYASTPGIGSLWGGVRVAYVLRDVLILAVAVHFATAVRWSVSVLLTLLGVLSLLVYDVLFRIGRIHGEYLLHTPIDLGWLLFFIALGAAALVPSMAVQAAPRSLNGSASTSLRLGLVAFAAVLPSAVLLAESFGLPPWYQPLIVAVATVVLVLVLVRAADVAVRLRRQMNGERILRDAITDLAAAPDAATVTAALDHAVRRLLPPGADFRLALGLDGGGSKEVELRPTTSLPPPLAARLGDYGVTLVIPLHRRRSQATPPESTMDYAGEATDPDAEAGGSSLLLRADPAALGALQPRLDDLATQAAFALDRMSLQEQVVRRTREEYFRTLILNSTDVILILDDDNRIRYASPSAEAIFGAAPLHGVSLPRLVEGAERSEATRLLEHLRTRPPTAISTATRGPAAASLRCDWTVRAAGGDPARVEVFCRDLRGDPSVGGLVVTLRDVTDQRRLQNELTQRAFHDPLTGLGNRLLFTDTLNAAVRGPATARGVIAVLFIDLDDLKVVNDALGHEVGDDVLARIGGRLQSFVSANASTPEDLAARLGGDEFAVLLAGAADAEAADEAAIRLVAALGQPIHIAGREVTCTASVGVATTTEDVDSAAELLRRADLALYAAKGTGRGHWRRYEPWMRNTVLDVVKLDRTFIQHMTVSAQQHRLVEGIVGLTELLGLHVVAEGIETDLELALAKQAGCLYGQGYLFARPMPDDAVPEWLNAQQTVPA